MSSEKTGCNFIFNTVDSNYVEKKTIKYTQMKWWGGEVGRTKEALKKIIPGVMGNAHFLCVTFLFLNYVLFFIFGTGSGARMGYVFIIIKFSITLIQITV